MSYVLETIGEHDLGRIILDAGSDDGIIKTIALLKNSMLESNFRNARWVVDRDLNSYLFKIFEDTSVCIFLFFYQGIFYQFSVLEIQWKSDPKRRMEFSKHRAPTPDMAAEVVENLTKAFAAHGLRGIGGAFDEAAPVFEGNQS